MKPRLLELLAAPCCGGPLVPRGTDADAEWRSGELACEPCSRSWPIVDGIPRFTPAAARGEVSKTRESFAWEWSRHPYEPQQDRRELLQELQLGGATLDGLLVLDAGCGMGRYSLQALELGAEVVALDLSAAVDRLADRARSEPRLHVVQGDLLNPPLRSRTFDLAYSHGVLHHAADTRTAFLKVAALVKPGGLLSAWVYGRAGTWAQFSTNPLRADRGWVGRHRRAAWVVVGVRHLASDALRFVTTRLPLPLVHALCHPLTWLGAVPGLKYLTFSVKPDYGPRFLENFDWIAPPLQHHHVKEELVAWCGEAGFDVLSILPHGLVPKPGVLARRRGA